MAKQEDHQDRLYYLLDQLQKMAKELPGNFQQRIPYELLSELAGSLAQGQILEIVNMLTEVQQATEKHLFQQRLQLLNKQQVERQGERSSQMDARHKEELKQYDMRLVTQLDQKVSDQQVTLERAGVPGFFVTNNPKEVQVQMYLLDFMVRIGNKQYL